MDRYRTTTVLPVAHLHGATSALRSELCRRILDDGGSNVPDWSTLRVVGPIEVFDRAGVIRFEYRGSVEPRRLAELPNVRRAAGRIDRRTSSR
jgi:hypothetical protein